MGSHERYLEEQRLQHEYAEQLAWRDLLDEVAKELSVALEVGRDFRGWTDEAVADELIACGWKTHADFDRVNIVAAIKSLRT